MESLIQQLNKHQTQPPNQALSSYNSDECNWIAAAARRLQQLFTHLETQQHQYDSTAAVNFKRPAATSRLSGISPFRKMASRR